MRVPLCRACDCSVPRYKLLLEQLLKFTTSLHPDLPLLTAALTQISVTASHINEAVRRREAMDAMVAIEERFMSSPGFVHASRVFIRQASLTKVGKSGAAKQEHFFLFNDMLASARTVMGRYVLKKKVMIDSHFGLGSDHATQHAANAPPTRFGLLVLYRDGGCLSLYFQQQAEKEAWLADIERCIAQAANTIPVQVQAAEKDRDKEREREVQQQHDGSISEAGQSSDIADKERSLLKERDEEKESAAGGAGSSSSAADRQCALCCCAFTLFNRRHNCRQCGRSVCGDCSRSRLILHAEERRPERVCDGCALSAESTRPAASTPNISVNVSSPVLQPSSPSSSSSSSSSVRSMSSRSGGGHHYSPSCSFNLPTLADVPEHAQQTSNAQSPSSVAASASASAALSASPSSSSSPAASAGVLSDSVGVAVSQQAKRAAAHTRAASSSAALWIAAMSEPSGPYPPMAQWDCATLLRWLCEPEIGFEQFVEGFAKFHVDGPTLIELTEDELRDEIGMREQLHRKRLRKLIDRLAHGPALPTSPQPPPSPRSPNVAPTLTLSDDRVPKGIWRANYQPVHLTALNNMFTSVGAATTSSASVSPTASSVSPSLQSALLPSSPTASSPLPFSAASALSAVSPAAEGAALSPLAAPPAMPKRAAPSLPQRQRNKAVSERWATALGEKGEVRCLKCGRMSEIAGLKFCSNCGSFVSDSSRGSVDDQLHGGTFEEPSTMVGRISPTSSSNSRCSSTSNGADSSGSSVSNSRVGSTIAQRAALFDHQRKVTTTDSECSIQGP